MLTPRSLNVKLGPSRNYQKGRAAIRHYANQTARPFQPGEGPSRGLVGAFSLFEALSATRLSKNMFPLLKVPQLLLQIRVFSFEFLTVRTLGLRQHQLVTGQLSVN